MSRTFGETKDCAGCRFWSELIAKGVAGRVLSMCLAERGPFFQDYTSALQACDGWKSGHLGAVDEPVDYGLEGLSLYGTEEAQS